MAYFYGKDPIFTDNALQRMAKHNVSQDQVKNVLQNYNRAENSTIPGFADFKLYSKVYNNYEIGVMAKKRFMGFGKTKVISVWRRSYKKR